MTISQEQIEAFKKKLLAAKEEIQKDLMKLREGLDFGSDIDYAEETAETEEFSHYLGIKKPLEDRLKAIDEALQKIEKGTFGSCEKCGREIEKKLLTAAPHSKLCKKCKGKI